MAATDAPTLSHFVRTFKNEFCKPNGKPGELIPARVFEMLVGEPTPVTPDREPVRFQPTKRSRADGEVVQKPFDASQHRFTKSHFPSNKVNPNPAWTAGAKAKKAATAACARKYILDTVYVGYVRASGGELYPLYFWGLIGADGVVMKVKERLERAFQLVEGTQIRQMAKFWPDAPPRKKAAAYLEKLRGLDPATYDIDGHPVPIDMRMVLLLESSARNVAAAGEPKKRKRGADEEEEDGEENEAGEEAEEDEEVDAMDEVVDAGVVVPMVVVPDIPPAKRVRITPQWIADLLNAFPGVFLYYGSTTRFGVDRHVAPASFTKEFGGMAPVTASDGTFAPTLGNPGAFLSSLMLDPLAAKRAKSELLRDSKQPLSLATLQILQDAILFRRHPSFWYEIVLQTAMQRTGHVVTVTNYATDMHRLRASNEAKDTGTLKEIALAMWAAINDPFIITQVLAQSKVLSKYLAKTTAAEPLTLTTVLAHKHTELLVVWLLLNAHRVGAAVVNPDKSVVRRPLLLVDPPSVAHADEEQVHWVELRASVHGGDETWRGGLGKGPVHMPGSIKGIPPLAAETTLEDKSEAAKDDMTGRIFAYYAPMWKREIH